MRYFLTDHLGSIRVIVDQAGTVKERNDYYPFGGKYAVTGSGVDAGSRWKYNGKEEQTTGGLGFLDYGARMYDWELGRWFGVDPVAEQYGSWTPYAYTVCNPIRFIDPNGMWLGDPPGFLGGWNKGIGDYNNKFWGWFDSRLRRPGLLLKDAGNQSRGMLTFLSDIIGISNMFGRNETADAMAEMGRTISRIPSMSSEELGGLAASSVIFVTEMGMTRKVPVGKLKVVGKVGRAAKGENNIALGLGDDLFKFAKHKDFQAYRDFSTGFQQEKILSTINNSNNNLHFNLTGFSKYRFSKFNPNDPVSFNNITNWELYSILNNQDALKRTTFYRFSNGSYNVVPNPFK